MAAVTGTFFPDLPHLLSKHPKLSAEQAGHLRHFHNISAAIDGDWPHMGSQEPAQEFLDAYRYQLATMAYGAGVTHYHRLPAMRGLFKPLIRRLVYKMLRREVWGYWFLTSHSGNRVDPDLTELRKPWADPIVRENIMYSGHLLLMTSLYAMLFDDDEFEKPGSLTFRWDPLFWGLGPEKFQYDNRSLQEAILKEMERNGWVGVCCEPNLVFVVCNQFPIIAMRYNDVRDGTDVTVGVLEKYQAALGRKKMVTTDGLYVDWLALRRDTTAPAKSVGFTAWANAFMNTWNPAFVRSGFESQSTGFITNVDGKVELQQPAIANEIRRLVREEGVSANAPETLQRAVEFVSAQGPKFAPPYKQPTFGYVVKWLSELGKSTELDGLLAFADAQLQPTWENGGLYYPRNDEMVNEEGRWRHMDPFSGNAAIGYARLNVEDGQRKMWDRPWTRDDLAARPWVDGLDLAQNVDCLRGVWDEESKAMIVTLRAWSEKPVLVQFSVKNLEEGTWVVYDRGALSETHTLSASGEIRVKKTVEAGEEIDIVVIKEQHNS